MTDHVRVKQDGGDLDHTQQHTATNPSPTQPQRFGNSRRIVPPDLSREEAVRRLQIFYRLSRVLSDSDNKVGRMVQAVANLTAEMIGDMAVITLLNEDDQTYRIAAYHDPDPEAVALYEQTLEGLGNIPRSQGWVSKVLETAEPVMKPEIDWEEAQAQAVPALREFARRVGIAGILIVPIRGRGEILGTISLTRHTGGRPYTDSNRDFLVEIGQRVGMAIESATLVESLRRQVDARLLAREALASSEQRFLSVFHSAPLGIKIMDLLGNIQETNSTFRKMSGYDEADLAGSFFYDLVHPDDVPSVLAIFKKLKVTLQPQPMIEHRLCRKDDSILWVRTTFAGVSKGPTNPALSLVFGIVEDITERKEADAQLMELRQHLQRSIELERLRLAQNLHDTPLQELYAVIYKLEELRPTTRPATSEIIGNVILDIKKTLDGLRATASELRPPALSRFGLEKAIRSYAEDFRLKHPAIKLQLSLAQDHQLLGEGIRLVLFRVFQEAMTNVLRHSRATEVQVIFSFDAEEARIEIIDNGCGFDVPHNWMANAREGHYGLAGMAERVGAAGGTLRLDSHPGGPTTITAVIPC